jgi:hypothetical protein
MSEKREEAALIRESAKNHFDAAEALDKLAHDERIIGIQLVKKAEVLEASARYEERLNYWAEIDKERPSYEDYKRDVDEGLPDGSLPFIPVKRVTNDPHPKGEEPWTTETLGPLDYEVLVHAAMLHGYTGELLRGKMMDFLVGKEAWL